MENAGHIWTKPMVMEVPDFESSVDGNKLLKAHFIIVSQFRIEPPRRYVFSEKAAISYSIRLSMPNPSTDNIRTAKST